MLVFFLGIMLHALPTFSHLMHIKSVTNWNSINVSCYYRVVLIWEVSIEKVSFNQGFKGDKLRGGWCIAWERLLQKVGRVGYFHSQFSLIPSAEERKQSATGYEPVVSLDLLMEGRRA